MRNGIVRRMTALLLTMACIITGTPETLLTTYAEFKTLTIGDDVKYLYGDAFESADIQQLNYCSNAESVESSSASGVFHSADIYALNIGENVTQLPSYLFCGLNLTQDTLTLPDGLKRIGAYAIPSRSLSPKSISIGTLQVGENLEYIVSWRSVI